MCKHWLRHLCKKGDDCEFLHEYDMAKMPPCYFFQKFGECNNKDCQYMHADSVKTHDCAWYDRGFCKHGQLHCIILVRLEKNILPQDQTAEIDIQDEFCAKTISVVSAHRVLSAILFSKYSNLRT